MALASVTDYETLTGTTVADEDESRIEALLGWASDAVLAGAHGQTIEEATSSDVDLVPFEGVVYLPQRPVTDVASVAVVDLDGTTTELSEGEYRWTPGGDGRPSMLIRRRNNRDSWWGFDATSGAFAPYTVAESVVRVTYTHGWATIPGPLVATVCAMAASAARNGANPTPKQAAVGPFSASFSDADAQSPTFDLTPAARSAIDRYCRVRGPVSAPVEPGR